MKSNNARHANTTTPELPSRELDEWETDAYGLHNVAVSQYFLFIIIFSPLLSLGCRFTPGQLKATH